MRENRMKRMLAEGQAVFGAWATLADPAIVEIIGYSGYDFALIDQEHTTNDFRVVESMVRAADAVGVSTLLRVQANDEKVILRVLETGAQGILVPHIRTAEDARLAVNAVKYAPVGDRGVTNISRAAGYGSVPYAQHLEQSNRELICMLLLEDREAVDNIESIVEVPGVDAIFVGPGDLARSLGVQAAKNDPTVGRAIDRIFEVVRGTQVALCIPPLHFVYYRTVAEWLAAGARIFPHSIDVSVLLQGFREELAAVKADLPK